MYDTAYLTDMEFFNKFFIVMDNKEPKIKINHKDIKQRFNETILNLIQDDCLKKDEYYKNMKRFINSPLKTWGDEEKKSHIRCLIVDFYFDSTDNTLDKDDDFYYCRLNHQRLINYLLINYILVF